MKWFISAVIIVTAMFLPVVLNAGGGVTPATVPPISIPEPKKPCGCECQLKEVTLPENCTWQMVCIARMTKKQYQWCKI